MRLRSEQREQQGLQYDEYIQRSMRALICLRRLVGPKYKGVKLSVNKIKPYVIVLA